MRNRLRGLLHDDTGAVTLYFVILSVGFLLIAGLVVDGAGRVQANQQAYSTADAAARAAANAISGTAVLNGSPEIDGPRAVAAANDYLSAAGVAGTASISGDHITVTVTSHYDPIFIPINLPVDATATAQLLTR